MNKQIMFTIPVDEFETIIRECVRCELQGSMQRQTKSDPVFIGAKEAASILKISIPTLRKYTLESHIRSYRIGHTIRYKKDEIEKAAEPIQVVKYSKL